MINNMVTKMVSKMVNDGYMRTENSQHMSLLYIRLDTGMRHAPTFGGVLVPNHPIPQHHRTAHPKQIPKQLNRINNGT